MAFRSDNEGMKIIYLFILIVHSLNVCADTVRVLNPTTLSVTGITDATFSLYVDEPSGDATSEEAPAKVYVPIHNQSITLHDEYFSLYGNGGLTTLFDTTDEDHKIHFPLTVSPSASRYLYAVAKSPNQTGYKLIAKYASTIASVQDISFSISPKEICAQFSTDCNGFDPLSSNDTSPLTYKLYFFVSATGIGIGETVDLATYTGGVYFDVSMSNRVYSTSEIVVSITDSKKGDARVILNYSANNTMTDFKKVVVFKHDFTPVSDNLPIGSYSGDGALLDRDFQANQSGELTVNELVNDTPVILSIGLQDKYGFVTTLSKSVGVTPAEIQELLKKNSCFLLTAGFGEEHYIINYFRHYRDQVLTHNWLGKIFIRSYYQNAPKYALMIYQHPTMRWSIRTMAYILYFFFNYYGLILLFLFSWYFIYIRFYKRKVNHIQSKIGTGA
jgi:hypothetical protein